MVPGWLAPSTSTAVPVGSDPLSQPFVSVLPPVPEQCAAWPMYSVPALSKKTKLAVHCAPSVTVCTPGWTVADDAGAHVGAPSAVAGSSATAANIATAVVNPLNCMFPPCSCTPAFPCRPKYPVRRGGKPRG